MDDESYERKIWRRARREGEMGRENRRKKYVPRIIPVMLPDTE